MKCVVYTAIYGEKDALKDPLVVNPNVDYLCFTDNKNIKSNVWKIIHHPAIHTDPVRSAKIFKVKPHEFLSDYDISLWVDANFLIKTDLQTFFQKSDFLSKAGMMLFQHDQGRNCIYDEANTIMQDRKDDPALVNAQMNKYREEKFPPQHGLSANSIMLKKHNDSAIIALGDKWWSEIQQYSRRDQLSLYYCIWKLDIRHYLLKFPRYNIRNNEWFCWMPHNYERQKW
jgi:hypothetical protein|tara:strand:- start:2346 stop:3029 length:684 start_codon:yes stop_codon:yes gene_type:complete